MTDGPYAERLVDLFALPATKIDKLSRARRAALMRVLGLAARAPITMFDEPHLGMDCR